MQMSEPSGSGTQMRPDSRETQGASNPPGIEVKYNHDLNVSDQFLSSYPAIQGALKDERLVKGFKYYDSRAKRQKRGLAISCRITIRARCSRTLLMGGIVGTSSPAPSKYGFSPHSPRISV